MTLLIGLPGSGKSTLARELARESPQRCVVATDTIREQLFGDESIQGPWLPIQREVERQLREIAGAGLEGIYDATNAGRKSRREAIARARDCGFTYITALWLNTPVEICLERNRSRSRQVPDEVIWRMYRQLSEAPPSLEDGCDRLFLLKHR